jgi:transposase InsO family protein
MSHLLSSFWGKGGRDDAGGDSLERSESESPPASRPAEGAPPASDVDVGGLAVEGETSAPPADLPPASSAVTSPSPAGSTAESDSGNEPSSDGPGSEREFWDSDWNEPYEAVREDQDQSNNEAVVGDDEPAPLPPNLVARRRGTLSKPEAAQAASLSAEQKLLLLDTWQRSGLPARDFGAMVNVSRHTLYSWKRRFEELGPAGLMDQPRGVKRGSKLPELTKRSILMLKTAHPDWGCQRISDMLLRGPALPASPTAVARVLHEAGYEMQEQATRPHPPQVRSFERAKPNQLWQTDLFTFVLKRQNRRVYLVAFMDDHSRFITGYGLHASQSAVLVLEVLRAAIAAYGVPQEILTDNGSQYVTWRGKSQFTRELEKRGIHQIVASPRRPQTLGKIERFWGTLWRECVETAVFLDLADARQRIGLFIDHYNLQRPHQGIEGLVPADRFFYAAPEVLKTLKERVADNARELARHGIPKKPFYLTGQIEGQPFSVHREGDRVVLHRAGQPGEEIDLVAKQPAAAAQSPSIAPREQLPPSVCPDGSPLSLFQHGGEEAAPGTSALDTFLAPAGNSEIEDPAGEESKQDSRQEGGA